MRGEDRLSYGGDSDDFERLDEASARGDDGATLTLADFASFDGGGDTAEIED